MANSAPVGQVEGIFILFSFPNGGKNKLCSMDFRRMKMIGVYRGSPAEKNESSRNEM